MEGINQIRTEWDLVPLLNGDNDPQLEHKKEIIQKSHQEFVKKWKDRDDYLKYPEKLKEALDDFNELSEKHTNGGDLMYYYWLRSSQDQSNTKIKAEFSKTQNFSKKLENDVNFFLLRVSRIPASEHKNFLFYPGLANYRHRIERLFEQSKYLLSEEEEKIMNLKAKIAHHDWVMMVSNFLSKEEREVTMENGKKQQKSFSAIIGLLSDRDKKVRDSSAKAFNDILEKHADVAEAELNAILGNKKVDDELRNMHRPDLYRHVHDDIDSEVVDTLINAVSKRFEISKRFYRLKARLLGLKKIEYHERGVHYGKLDKNYGYEEAVNIVYKVFRDLDSEFAEIYKNFNENGHIDAFPRKGKRDGAFCAYWNSSNPVYVLLNHTGKIRDVLTIAHEFGHAINDELIRKKQNAMNFGTPTSTAEVASTFMEDFVSNELKKNVDDELELAILMMKLDRDTSAVQRQIACYVFEQELHKEYREKGYLSRTEIGKLFQKHMHEYMGEYVEQSPGSENWWIYWAHIRNFFYNYSYASGILIAKSMQNSVKKDKQFIGKVKEFMSTGLSDSPRNIFMKMGIDITKEEFWNKGLDEIEANLKEAEKLAKKLGKI